MILKTNPFATILPFIYDEVQKMLHTGCDDPAIQNNIVERKMKLVKATEWAVGKPSSWPSGGTGRWGAMRETHIPTNGCRFLNNQHALKKCNIEGLALWKEAENRNIEDWGGAVSWEWREVMRIKSKAKQAPSSFFWPSKTSFTLLPVSSGNNLHGQWTFLPWGNKQKMWKWSRKKARIPSNGSHFLWLTPKTIVNVSNTQNHCTWTKIYHLESTESQAFKFGQEVTKQISHILPTQIKIFSHLKSKYFPTSNQNVLPTQIKSTNARNIWLLCQAGLILVYALVVHVFMRTKCITYTFSCYILLQAQSSIWENFIFASCNRAGSTWVTLEDTLGLKQILTMSRMCRLVDARHITLNVVVVVLLLPLVILPSIQSRACYGHCYDWQPGSALSELRILTNGDLVILSRRDVEEDENRKWPIVIEIQPEAPSKTEYHCWWQTVVRGGLHVSSHDLSYQRSRKKLLLLFMDHLLIILALPSTAVIKHRHDPPNWPAAPNFVNLKWGTSSHQSFLCITSFPARCSLVQLPSNHPLLAKCCPLKSFTLTGFQDAKVVYKVVWCIYEARRKSWSKRKVYHESLATLNLTWKVDWYSSYMRNSYFLRGGCSGVFLHGVWGPIFPFVLQVPLFNLCSKYQKIPVLNREN